MLLLKLMTPPGRAMLPYTTRHSLEPLGTITSDKILFKMSWLANNKNSHDLKMKRFLHTTRVHRDMEGAFRAIGGGIAAMGVIGPGVGMGIVFGNLLSATARNPSLANKLFQFGIMGAAFCESIAFFALMIAFLNL